VAEREKKRAIGCSIITWNHTSAGMSALFQTAFRGKIQIGATVRIAASRMKTEVAPIVFIVDDDLSVRRTTERLVRTAGFNAQTFTSAREFLKNPRPDGPACLILDVRMPGLDGMQLQRELTQSGIHIPIIFITGHGDIPMSVRAMKAGAVEFLTKPFRSQNLLEAIRSAIERDRSAHKERSESGELRERYEQLTPREREVMTLVVTGMLNKQVAGELATTERTIKFHRAHIMQKMQAESLADLVRMAEKLGVSGKH
jgi:FixJ family two-component response regulator